MATADSDRLLLREQIGGICLLTIHWPDKLNALTPGPMSEPDEALDQAAREQLADHVPFSLEMAKRAVNRASEIPLIAGLGPEETNHTVNFGTVSARDRLRAFASRRKPQGAPTIPSSSQTTR